MPTSFSVWYEDDGAERSTAAIALSTRARGFGGGAPRESDDRIESISIAVTLVSGTTVLKGPVAKGRVYVASGFTRPSMIPRRRRLTGMDAPESSTSSGPLFLSRRTSVM